MRLGYLLPEDDGEGCFVEFGGKGQGGGLCIIAQRVNVSVKSWKLRA